MKTLRGFIIPLHNHAPHGRYIASRWAMGVARLPKAIFTESFVSRRFHSFPRRPRVSRSSLIQSRFSTSRKSLRLGGLPSEKVPSVAIHHTLLNIFETRFRNPKTGRVRLSATRYFENTSYIFWTRSVVPSVSFVFLNTH